jgi:hypothetical protein
MGEPQLVHGNFLQADPVSAAYGFVMQLSKAKDCWQCDTYLQEGT